MLLWIDQTHSPDSLKKMLNDDSFQRSLLDYLEDIIKEDVDEFTLNGNAKFQGLLCMLCFDPVQNFV